ncbi:unnamed protein product [Darwinula stevensoni]|uniref:WWE domain-containing protein n=1 Tax=Darwinula stevensoni TaxID=69355 RepID=A0A7R8XAA6_9CRUS|nr:unnamed protein product [Darwinula stevensoni]CAG0890488.1 unnamed protein product [Darwinula stevensoni]
MEKKTEVTAKLVEKLQRKTMEFLQPNPNMADKKYALDDDVKQKFLGPIHHLQSKDIKELNEEFISWLAAFTEVLMKYHQDCSEIVTGLHERILKKKNEAAARSRKEFVPKTLSDLKLTIPDINVDGVQLEEAVQQPQQRDGKFDQRKHNMVHGPHETLIFEFGVNNFLLIDKISEEEKVSLPIGLKMCDADQSPDGCADEKYASSSNDEVAVPGICGRYNAMECEASSGCIELHLCLNYILDSCTGGCLLNHDILDPQCEQLLKNAGVETSRKDLKMMLRMELKEQRLDAIFELQRQCRRQMEEAAKRKVFHAHEDDGEVEVPEVCIFLLNGRCLDGESGLCKRLHAGTPYHWQVMDPVTNKWINLSKNQSFKLEHNFSDPAKDTVQLDSFTSEEVHLTERRQLKELLNDTSYEMDFKSMKLNTETKGGMDIRRLSTQSYVMTGGKKHSTIWWWYFLDVSGKWMKYGDTTAEHKSSSDLKSADIEKQFLQGNGCVGFRTKKFKYEINFETMQQENLKTNTRRDIRRRPAPPEGSSNTQYRHLPSHWVPMQEAERCKMVLLDLGSQEFLNVAAHMPSFTICKITRVQNPNLWEKYQNKRLELLRKYNDNAGQWRSLDFANGEAKLERWGGAYFSSPGMGVRGGGSMQNGVGGA